MTSIIAFGGIGVVIAVFGIFAFILAEILPLFQKAKIRPAYETRIDLAGAPAVLGLDEWSELPFLFDGKDRFIFHPAGKGASQPSEQTIPLPEGATVTCHAYDSESQRMILGTSSGLAGYVQISYSSTLDAGGQRAVSASVSAQPFFPIAEGSPEPGPILALDYADSGQKKLYAAIHGPAAAPQLSILTLEQKRSLLGAGRISPGERANLTALLEGETPTAVLAAGTADSLVVSSTSGEVLYLFREPSGWKLRQRFRPFQDPGEALGGVSFLFGDVSLVTCSASGALRLFSLYIPEGGAFRQFGLTKEFPPVTDGVRHFVASQRNKAFLVASDRELVLCYATTAAVRKRIKLPAPPLSLALDGKFEHIGVLESSGTLRLYELRDPHPEAGWRAFFGKVWYEGAPRAEYTWQSTGGTDDFESKLSLVPLMAGTLKGTLYAMLFAVPIALLAAIYVSHFAHPRLKKTVKPLMEIMASLPSVVLGFLAALWLAPLVEARVPSLLAIIILFPLAAAGMGLIWSYLPIRYRNALPRGSEFLILMPIILLIAWAGWSLGPVIEKWLFVATMPDGSRIADFRLWWPQFTGSSYDQRNCLVVGFMMGFAVIPVIFTISEDSLSNVPPSITSASEALGASRWQVVRTIVIPIAAAGIFSALMIGFGRAVGETMIVVMATGNTPVMEWNIFSGMRTLSANIAVELPEAPVHSTHYRALFLGAMVLFLMTFTLNTAAEILRQRLRKKFQLV